jgi:hypothetical protein
MTRRRLILAIVATVLFGIAWWQSLDRLSAEEQRLVGTWYRSVPPRAVSTRPDAADRVNRQSASVSPPAALPSLW